jgi:hypothetical protein
MATSRCWLASLVVASRHCASCDPNLADPCTQSSQRALFKSRIVKSVIGMPNVDFKIMHCPKHLLEQSCCIFYATKWPIIVHDCITGCIYNCTVFAWTSLGDGTVCSPQISAGWLCNISAVGQWDDPGLYIICKHWKYDFGRKSSIFSKLLATVYCGPCVPL